MRSVSNRALTWCRWHATPQLKTEYTSLWESYQQVQLKYNKIYDERVRAWFT